jgi:anti-sigma regulatory factor (Ser/Thr protein kinase)
MDNESAITVEAKFENLAVIRRFIEQNVELVTDDQDVNYDIVFAVNELATNIIVHGYKNQPGQIEVKMRQDGDSLVIRLIDQAPEYDPTDAATPDLTQPLEKRPLGGLGVYLAGESVDEISHASMPDGGNELILVKKIG